VSDTESRPHLPRAQAASLLNAQIMAGQDLRQAVARATTLEELQALRPQLSTWSTRNEHVLVKIFGEPERQDYRLATPRAVATGSIGDRRAKLERRTDARLRYLHGAATRVELAEQEPSSARKVIGLAQQEEGDNATLDASAATMPEESARKSRWRAAVTNPWIIAICASLIAAALIAIGSYAKARITHSGITTVTGSVVCESGRQVVGVWIAASSGQSDSGYAHLGPPNPTGNSYPIGSSGTYSYLLPHGGTYAVHVGCGGSAAHWASRNYSPLLSGRTADLRCDDPTAATHGAVPRGRCTTGTGS
jgi:hypothetical protein